MERKNCPYHVVDSKKYEIGRFSVIQDQFLIDGKTYPYTYVDSQDGVCIIPVYNNKLVMIRQYRYTVDEWLFEFPAGAVEVGETPQEAAKRELLEETGFLADEWMDIGNYYMSEGILSAKCELYFARCSERKEVNADKTEQIEIRLTSIDEFEHMIENDQFRFMIGLVGWMQVKKRKLI